MKVSPRSAQPVAAAPKPRRQRCKNCPRFFHPREKGGSPQEFCSDNCRKEFHRNGAAFGALREKLPGYIDKSVAKHLGRPTEEHSQELLRELRALTATVGENKMDVVGIRTELLGEIQALAKVVEQLRSDFEDHRRGWEE